MVSLKQISDIFKQAFKSNSRQPHVFFVRLEGEVVVVTNLPRFHYKGSDLDNYGI